MIKISQIFIENFLSNDYLFNMENDLMGRLEEKYGRKDIRVLQKILNPLCKSIM